MNEMIRLPAVLFAIEEAAGTEAMLLVADRFGGRRVDLPARPEARNWLSELVGVEAAQAIVSRLGAGRIDIPLGPAGSYAALRRSIAKQYLELQAAGASAAEISRTLGITERAVRYRRSQERQRHEDQGNLF